MTFDASQYPAHLLTIRYVDPPRDAVPVRRSGQALVKAAIVMAAAAILIVGAIGFAQAAPTAPDRVTDHGPVRGEFRLAPGNQQPPGYVVPLGKASDQPDRDGGPAGEWRPSLIPIHGGVSLSIPKPGEIFVGPKPPGRVPTA
ncbi:MAG TPA: hypothetical protein VFO05_14480 [Candidatus Limnocylindrales bacterium]|nr:hypothetical protein [Candidatus Limnocylindrales bacterium]